MRLAKNTILMYFRLGVGIVVNFVATRVVFNVLGIENYGLYGVVAGIIVLFSFVSSALASSAQRYYSYELGRENYVRLQSIYNALLRIFCIISLVIVFLAETVGLWFLNNKMDFPDGKLELANFVYQIAILTTIVQVFRTPYDAAIISSEKFNFYAYTSLLNAFLQLGVVFLLYVIPFESTKVYVMLLLVVACVMLVWYIQYCQKNFSYIHYNKKIDMKVFKELFTFSGWSFFGALCNMGYRQGVNVVINLFFGVTLNAAFGIANQVSALVNQFVAGFQSAYNPQITKTCSVGSSTDQSRIVSIASKVSFSLLLLVGLCACLNIDLLLNLWLGEVPHCTASLCTLMIIAAIVDTISDPFWIVIFATGKIKNYQVTCAILMIGNILLTILAFEFGMGVVVSMYIRILMNLGVLFARLVIVSKQTQISISNFLKNVVIRDIIVIITLCPLSYLTILLSEGYTRLFVATPVVVIITLLLIFSILFDQTEKTNIKQLILNKIKH